MPDVHTSQDNLTSAANQTFDGGGGSYTRELYDLSSLPEGAYRSGLPAVGADGLAAYDAEGFLALDAGISLQTVESARQGLRELVRPGSGARLQYESRVRDRLEGLTETERVAAIRKVSRFVEFSDCLKKVAYNRELLSVVQLMLKDEPVLLQDMAFLKPADGREKPWHQDNASFRLLAGSPIVGVWIAIDPATTENGCMCVVPRSHKGGPRRHSQLRDLQIRDSQVDVSRGVAIPLQPGGLLFFDGLLHHGTPKNTTSKSRWSLQFHYTVALAPKVSEVEHQAVFGGKEPAAAGGAI